MIKPPAFLLLAFLALTGCHTKPVAAPAAGATPLGPIKDANQKLDQATQALSASNSVRDGQIAGSLYVIREYSSQHPSEPVTLEFIDREIGLLLKKIGIEPTAEQQLDARHRVELLSANKKEEANKAYESALSLVQKEAEEKGKLQAEVASLRTDLAEKLRAKDEELVKNQRDNQAKLDQLDAQLQSERDKHAKSLQQWTARILVIVGVFGVVATGILVWMSFSTGGVTVIKKGIGAWAGSLLLIGSGFIVSQPWFLWVAGSAMLILLIGVAFLIWHNKKVDITLLKSVQSIEEQHIDNPVAALDLKSGYQESNLGDAEKRIIEVARDHIDTTYIQKQAKLRAPTEFPTP